MIAVFLISGFVVLILGAKILVKGASGLALSMKISPLVVGLTVVAFGTSAPEAFVNLQAALAGKSDLGTGNVVGSCIYNLLFVLGISALVKPIRTHMQVILLDTPFMLGAGIFLYVTALSFGKISFPLALGMLIALALYTWKLISKSKMESKEVQTEFLNTYPPSKNEIFKNSILTLIGLVLLSLGADWLVDSAVKIARALGVSEVMIGMTIITFGTTLPEFTSNIIAVKEGQDDIAVGNIIGSNIFNILFVLGLTGLFSKNGIPFDSLLVNFSLPVMLGSFILIFPLLYNQLTITRQEGAILSMGYVLYFTGLVLDAKGIVSLSGAGHFFLLGLTLITLSGIYLSFYFSRKKRKEQRPDSKS